uniref:Ribonucleoprotein PTB-binding 2-like n=2 Tax=Hirondellea gigas TaxID=1518452 RepID=A0A6A7FUY5_9CRUS
MSTSSTDGGYSDHLPFMNHHPSMNHISVSTQPHPFWPTTSDSHVIPPPPTPGGMGIPPAGLGIGIPTAGMGIPPVSGIGGIPPGRMGGIPPPNLASSSGKLAPHSTTPPTMNVAFPPRLPPPNSGGVGGPAQSLSNTPQTTTTRQPPHHPTANGLGAPPNSSGSGVPASTDQKSPVSGSLFPSVSGTPTSSAGGEPKSPVTPKWDVDEKEAIKRKIYELKRTFHNGRYLIVRHLPKDTLEQNVRSLLSGILIHSVQLTPSNPNMVSSNSTLNAHVLLAEPEVIENWSRLNSNSATNKTSNQSSSPQTTSGQSPASKLKNTVPKIPSSLTYKGHQISISPSSTENLLCVSSLPDETSEDEFTDLVSGFGNITYCFLMRSERTGISKGYGFVCYSNRDVALQARSLLDQRQHRGTLLSCDWVEPNIVTFGALHSCCLLVDNLPKDYRELGELRKIFSKVANPPYCQIGLCTGSEEDQWGLLEYSTATAAEDTVAALRGHTIRGHVINIRYCVPGKRAINLHPKISNDMKNINNNGGGGALLPEPPVNKVFHQLQNLTKSNPAFAESLRSIIMTQIQNLKESNPGGAIGPLPPHPPPPPGVPPPPPPPPPHHHLHHPPPPLGGGGPIHLHHHHPPPPPPPPHMFQMLHPPTHMPPPTPPPPHIRIPPSHMAAALGIPTHPAVNPFSPTLPQQPPHPPPPPPHHLTNTSNQLRSNLMQATTNYHAQPITTNVNHAQPPPPPNFSNTNQPLDDNLRALLAVFVSALTQPNLAANTTLSNLLSNQQLLTSLTNLINQGEGAGATNKPPPPSSSTGPVKQGPLLPTPPCNSNSNNIDSSNKVDTASSSSAAPAQLSSTTTSTTTAANSTTADGGGINPLLSGLLDSVGVNLPNTVTAAATKSINDLNSSSLTNGSINDPVVPAVHPPKERFDSLLNDAVNLQRLLGVLNPGSSTGMPPHYQPNMAAAAAQNFAGAAFPAVGLTASVQNGLSGSLPNLNAAAGTALPNGIGSIPGFSPIGAPPPQGLGMLPPHVGSLPNLAGLAGLQPLPQVDMFGLPTQPQQLLQHPFYQPPPHIPQPPPPPHQQVPPPHSTTMSMLLNAANSSKQQQQSQAATSIAQELLFQQTSAGCPTNLESSYLLTAIPPPPSPLFAGQPPTSTSGVGHRMMAPSSAVYQLTPTKSAVAMAALAHQQSNSLNQPTTVQYSPNHPFSNYPSVPTNPLATSLANYSSNSAVPSSGHNPYFSSASGVATSGTMVYNTPTKRKSRMLPSPEPSPEGGYIGQHSQGLGGHYQSSYMPRKRTKRN